jgi:hypothetical protein
VSTAERLYTLLECIMDSNSSGVDGVCCEVSGEWRGVLDWRGALDSFLEGYHTGTSDSLTGGNPVLPRLFACSVCIAYVHSH